MELCSWFVQYHAPVLVIATRIDDEFDRDHAAAIPGLGDEAQYADSLDKSGGTIIVRSGRSVVTITGTISKTAAVALAKLALPRL